MTDGHIQKARRLLTPAATTGGHWPMLGAAAMAAASALLMAGVMVLGPGVRFDEPVVAQPLFPNG